MKLDLLFEITPGNRKVTDVIDYGYTLSDLMAGNLPAAHEARVDIHVVADTAGILSGSVQAVVYMSIKSDGRISVTLHESLTLTDGNSILMSGNGITLPADKPGLVKVKGVFTFHTSSKKYAWLNSTMAVFEAAGDPSGSNFNLKAYSINNDIEENTAA